MPPPDITDLDILIDNLHHDPQPTDPTPISIPVPTYDNDDEARHLYSLKIPMSLWRIVKHNVPKGDRAEFTRQAISEKLTKNHPSVPDLVTAARNILHIVHKLLLATVFLETDLPPDYGQPEIDSLQDILTDFE